MKDLRDLGLIYLATPYSKYSAGIEQAFLDACKLNARLLAIGAKVYSPIAHTHPVAIHGGLEPLNHEFWLAFDDALLDVCNLLLVALMDGWRESKGIAYEIAFFERAGKPVRYLDVDTLQTREERP